MPILVSLSDQTLTLESPEDTLRFPVSTAAVGAGERHGSGATPRGRHLVRARFGAGLAPERDWILSRILWLGGLQPGLNQGGDVDSFRRFIYIHGTPDDQPMGEPASHGCIRMRNTDVITLFERVPVATPVTIVE